MSNKQLIPFSKELWETGEYDAVTKNQWTPVMHEITIKYVFGRINDEPASWDLYGVSTRSHLLDLMLRKKTKKKWVGLCKTDVFYDTKEECESETKFLDGFIKVIEVEI